MFHCQFFDLHDFWYSYSKQRWVDDKQRSLRGDEKDRSRINSSHSTVSCTFYIFTFSVPRVTRLNEKKGSGHEKRSPLDKGNAGSEKIICAHAQILQIVSRLSFFPSNWTATAVTPEKWNFWRLSVNELA